MTASQHASGHRKRSRARPDDSALIALLERLIAAQPAGIINIRVSSLTPCDLGAIDCLARLALEARRRGRSICLVGASQQLVELVAFSGLTGCLPCRPDSSVEVRR